MSDYKTLIIDEMDRKHKTTLWYRNHGHEAAICNSYRMVQLPPARNATCSISYVWETAELFLKTKEALEANEKRSAEGFRAD